VIINWWRRDGQAIAVSGDYSAVTSVIARAEDSSTIAFDSAKAATRDWTARSSTARGSPRQTSWMRARASSERGCPCARRSEGGARHSRPSRSLPSRSWHSVGRERRRRFAPGDPDLEGTDEVGLKTGRVCGRGPRSGLQSENHLLVDETRRTVAKENYAGKGKRCGRDPRELACEVADGASCSRGVRFPPATRLVFVALASGWLAHAACTAPWR